MLYALICDDRADAGTLRVDNRPAHLDYLASLGERLSFAGPFLDEAGKPTGSLVVVEAESLEKAQAMAAADPYAKAGLFEKVTIRRWNWVLNRPAA